MVIENPSFVIKHIKSRYLILIIGFICILLVTMLDFFEENQLGLSREVYITAAVTIFVLINLYRFLMDYHYVHVGVEKEKLVLKYYSLRSFAGKRKSVEIPITGFAKFEIEKKMMGMVPYLILYQRIKGKVAKYPPISISAYTIEQISELKALLNKLQQIK